MPRYNIQEKDPARYAKVKAEQGQLRAECARNSSMTMARLCPFCEHKIEILLRGTHGYSFLKCPKGQLPLQIHAGLPERSGR